MDSRWRTGPGCIGFLQIEGEVKRPVVEIIRVDEGLVDGLAVVGNLGVAKTILEIGRGLGKLLP